MLSMSSPHWLLVNVITVSALGFNIPSSPPANASSQLVKTPVGVSFEFFAYPEYVDNVPSTATCLENLKNLTGTWPPIRVGGTTQDRATYNSSSTEAVAYSVSDPKDAPQELTFGPSFLSLVSQYGGNVTLGLNRRLNNMENTKSAAAEAKNRVENLHAIEVGNEPNLFTSNDPIAGGKPWTADTDYASEVSWQGEICGNLSTSNLISAGIFLGRSPMSAEGLLASEGSSNDNVKNYCSHNYPQSGSSADLPGLMNHSLIASQIAPFAADVAAAASKSKPFVFGETNSVTQGGGGISPTYGAGLWLLDYTVQALIMGAETLFFHHGTVGNCQYCWWGKSSMGAPYYGAYMATLALAGVDQVAPLDDQTTTYAAYAFYTDGSPTKVLLYNSDYYTGGTRSSKSFTLSGLSASSVTAKRLTAASSTARVDQGQSPSIAGITFENGSCQIQGESESETTSVVNGQATFSLEASEALLIYLSS